MTHRQQTRPAQFIAFLMFINIISGENTQWYKHTCYKITNQNIKKSINIIIDNKTLSY